MSKAQHILQAALPVFIRYGYRKTTMGEIATAAGLSRQALYNAFASKPELFRALVEFHTGAGLEAMRLALATDARLADRLAAAADAWFGPHVEALRASPHAAAVAAELCEAAGEGLVGAKNRVLSQLTEAAADHLDGPTAQAVALTLFGAAKGFVSMSATRAEFRARLQQAADVLVGPRETP